MKNKSLVNYMNKAFMPLILSMLLVTCSKPETVIDNGGSSVVTPVPPTPQECKECVCNVKDPPNDLPWLKSIINATAPPRLGPLSTIYAYIYKGKQVIYVSNLSSSQLPMQVYDCKGDIVFSNADRNLAQLEWTEFLNFTRNEKTGEKLIWKNN